jgi:N-acetylglucosamine kinase-like BadF-type ATPase
VTQALAAVLAVDGGNSKTDLALAAGDGTLLASVRGPSISHQAVGLEVGLARLRELTAQALSEGALTAASPVADIGVYCVAGADLPRDVRMLSAGFAGLALTAQTVVLNDGFAPLRAGSERGWGVAVICGAGVNAVGLAPDGRSVRLAALGDISGDRGGGQGVGMDALGAAVRARDGRGERTILERLVPEHFGLRRPLDVTNALYRGRLRQRRLLELSPVVFGAAGDGDRVARRIVDELADELATMAIAMLRRLHLLRSDPDVVLAGGVFRTNDRPFYARIADRLRAAAPRARPMRLGSPPVLGAALIGLDRLEASAAAHRLLAASMAAGDRVATPLDEL